MVLKLRSGSYQAALLSATGLSDIEPDFAALQFMPLVFQNWDEVDYVRERIQDRLIERLSAKGFVLLFWADMGWVNFFCAKKATTPAEFKKMRMFTWAGDNKRIQIMKSLGYQPVALETDNILSSLGSGMIDIAPVRPAFALGGQVHTVAEHVLEVNGAPIVGAAIMRRDVFDKIPAELRPTLLTQASTAGRAIREEGLQIRAGPKRSRIQSRLVA